MVISTAAGLLGGWVALSFFPEAAQPTSTVFVNTMLAAVVSGAILGIVGVALGTLVRNQMLAITGALIYLFVIDPIRLITAMLALDIEAPELGIDTTAYLPPLTAMIVLLGYGAVFAATAIATSLRRDIE